jgi:hypothetical protein
MPSLTTPKQLYLQSIRCKPWIQNPRAWAVYWLMTPPSSAVTWDNGSLINLGWMDMSDDMAIVTGLMAESIYSRSNNFAMLPEGVEPTCPINNLPSRLENNWAQHIKAVCDFYMGYRVGRYKIMSIAHVIGNDNGSYSDNDLASIASAAQDSYNAWIPKLEAARNIANNQMSAGVTIRNR